MFFVLAWKSARFLRIVFYFCLIVARNVTIIEDWNFIYWLRFYLFLFGISNSLRMITPASNTDYVAQSWRIHSKYASLFLIPLWSIGYPHNLVQIFYFQSDHGGKTSTKTNTNIHENWDLYTGVLIISSSFPVLAVDLYSYIGFLRFIIFSLWIYR